MLKSEARNMAGRFKDFTDDEVYMLSRQAIEASFEIMMKSRYNEYEAKIHSALMNELADENKLREYGGAK